MSCFPLDYWVLFLSMQEVFFLHFGSFFLWGVYVVEKFSPSMLCHFILLLMNYRTAKLGKIQLAFLSV